MSFVHSPLSSNTFSQSLFAMAKAFGSTTVYVRLKQDAESLYDVFVIDPVFGGESLIGRIPGKTFFVEMRHAGVELKSAKPASHLRFRTAWKDGERHQARVSYAPSNLRERRQGVLGIVTFDSMKTYQKKQFQSFLLSSFG